MNRQQRRAEERKRQREHRADVIAVAAAYLANTDDSTVTGATVILPDGKMLYLDAAAMRAGKPADKAGRH